LGIVVSNVITSFLSGFTLFLAFVIDRLHHYLRKLVTLRKAGGTSREEVEKLQTENRSLREEEKSSNELKNLRQEVGGLSEKVKRLKSDTEEHEKKASAAEAHVNALQKQSGELLLEYDRLLEDNQILQAQVLSRG
jgi:B-cell receptor-associated protein 31